MYFISFNYSSLNISADMYNRAEGGRSWLHYLLEQKMLAKEDNYKIYRRLGINNNNMETSSNAQSLGKLFINLVKKISF